MTFSITVWNVVMLSVALFYSYAEWHNAEYSYAKCHYAECRGTLLRAKVVQV